jgi:hypothetical protein
LFKTPIPLDVVVAVVVETAVVVVVVAVVVAVVVVAVVVIIHIPPPLVVVTTMIIVTILTNKLLPHILPVPFMIVVWLNVFFKVQQFPFSGFLQTVVHLSTCSPTEPCFMTFNSLIIQSMFTVMQVPSLSTKQVYSVIILNGFGITLSGSPTSCLWTTSANIIV